MDIAPPQREKKYASEKKENTPKKKQFLAVHQYELIWLRCWRRGAVNACPINNYLFLIVAPVLVFINVNYVNNKSRKSE